MHRGHRGGFQSAIPIYAGLLSAVLEAMEEPFFGNSHVPGERR